MLKLALGALATLAMAPAVSAAAPENPLVKDAVVLDLKNIDLATVSGQRRLAIRMDQAARAVCGSGLATIHLALEEQARTCRAEVVADVRSRIEARGASTVANAPLPSRTALASLR
jgi:UrcA family protein